MAQRHHRELHVHCYRMLASDEEAEDAVQEAMLRAWTHRERIASGGGTCGPGSTGCAPTCASTRSGVGSAGPSSAPRPRWRGSSPTPDALLDEAPSVDDAPETTVIDRETIELAFLVALQALPPRQRAALIARDVLG